MSLTHWRAWLNPSFNSLIGLLGAGFTLSQVDSVSNTMVEEPGRSNVLLVEIGALARHEDIGKSELAARYPILKDCALGIADVQVRNMGTIGGSLAEADPN